MKPSVLARRLKVSEDDVRAALAEVARHLNAGVSGVRLYETDQEVSLMTDPDTAETVRDVLKKDVSGELTRPSVETLAIIAYRGPISKPELEQIRGVNCSLILRNLQMRGLVEAREDATGERYTISMEYLRQLGVTRADALPDYELLNASEVLNTLSSDTPLPLSTNDV